MARSNPSFLKRQKEQKRKEKAEEKRAARRARAGSPKEQEEEFEVLTGPRPLEDSLETREEEATKGEG